MTDHFWFTFIHRHATLHQYFIETSALSLLGVHLFAERLMSDSGTRSCSLSVKIQACSRYHSWRIFSWIFLSFGNASSDPIYHSFFEIAFKISIFWGKKKKFLLWSKFGVGLMAVCASLKNASPNLFPNFVISNLFITYFAVSDLLHLTKWWLAFRAIFWGVKFCSFLELNGLNDYYHHELAGLERHEGEIMSKLAFKTMLDTLALPSTLTV